jgi:superfamily I DNA and/or RNA helicase
MFQLALAAFLQALNGKLLKTKDKNTRRDIQKELRTLSKEERKRQQLAVKDVIAKADVVLTTLTGAFSRKLDNTTFDLVIIDEAAQALEIACWIALLKVMLHTYEHQNNHMHNHY